MIRVEVDVSGLEDVERRLGKMKDQAPKVLRSAINSTATEARKQLAQEAQSRYTVKNAGFNSAAKIRRATVSNLVATIHAGGRKLDIPRFHVTRPRSHKKGAPGAKAEVVAGGGLKEIRGASGIKAFSSTVPSGKSRTKQILQRQGAARYPVQVLHSVSVPKMLEMVYEGRGAAKRALKKDIQKIYNQKVQQKIGELMGK